MKMEQYIFLFKVKFVVLLIMPGNIKKIMTPFYGWGLNTTRLQSYYEEAVYFLPLSSQKFLVLIWLTWER